MCGEQFESAKYLISIQCDEIIFTDCNPNYDADIEPIFSQPGEASRYRRFKWGEFREKRFLGDFADIGEENQISHYRIDRPLLRPQIACLFFNYTPEVFYATHILTS